MPVRVAGTWDAIAREPAGEGGWRRVRGANARRESPTRARAPAASAGRSSPSPRRSPRGSPRESPRGSPLLGNPSFTIDRASLERLVMRARSPQRAAVSGPTDGTQARALPAVGAELDASGASGWTPLHRAVRLGDANLVAALLESGASHSRQTRFSGETPLHLAAQCGLLAVVQVLLDAQADPNAKTTAKEWTPLHFAAQHAVYADVAGLLLKAGADPNAEAIRGVTPAQLARRSGNVALQEWVPNISGSARGSPGLRAHSDHVAGNPAEAAALGNNAEAATRARQRPELLAGNRAAGRKPELLATAHCHSDS
jgi:hypothetical protein